MSHCVVCHRPSEVYLCGGCTGEVIDALRELVNGLLADLQITLTRQHKFGTGALGVVTRTDEQPIPFHAAASELSWVLNNTISTWARDLAESNPHLAANWTDHAAAAAWLARYPSLIAMHPAAAEMHDEITSVVKQVRRIVDCAPEKTYAGQCDGKGAEDIPGFPPCGSPLFAKPGMSWVRCSVCSREYDVEDRRRCLLASLENEVGSSARVAMIVTGLGVKVSASTIRMWVKRGHLSPNRWTVPSEPGGSARPLYRVGDVVSMAAKNGNRSSIQRQPAS